MQIQVIVSIKPKEVHQIYDTLKLMEQQEGTKKSRSQKRRAK